MRSWSRMAALACVLAVGPAAAVAVAVAAEPGEPPVTQKVRLRLQISGLGPEGCEVEIKPGHKACDFKPIRKTLDRNGKLELPGVEVKSTTADRDCLFAITLKEPGQEPLTIRRGYQLARPNPDKPGAEQVIDCWLRSPSLAAKDTPTRRVR